MDRKNTKNDKDVRVSIQCNLRHLFSIPRRRSPRSYSEFLPPPSFFERSLLGWLEFHGHSEHDLGIANDGVGRPCGISQKAVSHKGGWARAGQHIKARRCTRTRQQHCIYFVNTLENKELGDKIFSFGLAAMTNASLYVSLDLLLIVYWEREQTTQARARTITMTITITITTIDRGQSEASNNTVRECDLTTATSPTNKHKESNIVVPRKWLNYIVPK
ncbi:hypothetical protein V1527DRAFT_185722 [Lipomyces starkeyi]